MGILQFPGKVGAPAANVSGALGRRVLEVHLESARSQAVAYGNEARQVPSPLLKPLPLKVLAGRIGVHCFQACVLLTPEDICVCSLRGEMGEAGKPKTDAERVPREPPSFPFSIGK